MTIFGTLCHDQRQVGRGNKVPPLIQGGLRGGKGLPDTTVKQCDKVEITYDCFWTSL